MLTRIFTRRSSTLVDSFGRHHNYLRISLTEKCNLRCTYCMPEEGVPLSPRKDILTNDEIVKLVTLFREEGVNKIRLTGGEPTLRKDLVQLVKDINSVGGIESIGITTNGIVFNRYAEDLVKAGLTHVNISLDTLDPNKYAILSRRNGFEKVIKNIEFSRSLFKTVKINNVVMRGINDNEVVDFVRMTRDKNLDVRFIEWMPFGGNNFNSKKMVSYKESLAKIDEEIAPRNIIKINDSPNDTSKGYKIQGWTGSFGFISSMTDNFCGTCNRMRLTANGHLKVCLHDNAEVSLKDMLRNNSSDDQIKETISNAVNAKKFKHAGMENLKLMKNRPMILIGG
uniref:GTP 3',8-cyclase n=1 Tax=Rhabditophanes sp. KR3021 TaxID=114890 RepID=A0AC35TI44_9BILA